jgi:Uncharacterized conserved protein
MLGYSDSLIYDIGFIKEDVEKAYHEHDIGYKHIFSHKPTFIEFLRSFVKSDWVNSVSEKDLILLDKSYILSDFQEEESDIVYRVKREEEEVIFYVLLEFQSKVDFQMPIRLLFYMTEIWRDVLKNASNKERRRKNFKLPAVVPIVIYNGLNKWTAERSFRKLLNGEKFIQDNLIDFNYILLDVNRYTEEELLEVSNLVSAVFLLDSNVNEKQLIRRLKKSIFILRKITPEQFTIFKHWVNGIVKKRLQEDIKQEVEDILNKSDQREVENMVSNLERTLEKMEKKAIERGKIETATEMIKEGEPIEKIKKYTKLDENKILELIKQIGSEEIQ